MKRINRVIWLCAALAVRGVAAHPLDNAYLIGETDRNPLTYAAGEKMVFSLKLANTKGEVPAGEYRIDWKRTGDDGIATNGTVALPLKHPLVIETSIGCPGFVRIEAVVNGRDGKPFRKTFAPGALLPDGTREMYPWERDETRVFFEGGAGVAIDTLKGVPPPKDFAEFWKRQRARLSAVPIKVRRQSVKSPNKSVALWAVEIACAGKRPVTGYLSIPLDNSRKWPARLQTHGYGFFRHGPPDAIEGGEILLDINAHGQNLEAFGGTEEEVKALGEAIRANGHDYAFDTTENSNPETAYFNGMALRVMRALDYLKTLPEWNGRDLEASGSSQGGLQTVWAAALEPALTIARPTVPWCCDMGGGTFKRVHCSWGVPWVPELGYYDPINMARIIPKTCYLEIPRAGLGDYICPPSGLAVFYNNLTCPCEIRWLQGSTHSYIPYRTRYWIRGKRIEISPLPGERWWGGATIFGRDQPYSVFARCDQNRDNYCNQISPFFVSSAGRYLWSDKPMAWSATNGVLSVESSADIELATVGKTLREAFLTAASRHFPSDGKIPPEMFFSRPQYNHAIESHVEGRNQAAVERYVQDIVKKGFPIGIVIVDDYWMRDFGVWRFDSETFPDPKGMVERLHKLGAKVMLWVVPYVSADSLEGLDIYTKRWVVETPTPSIYGRACIVRWWSGYSFAYDFTVPEARKHYTDVLKGLQRDYGVDGFKFDGADLNHYTFTSPTGARFRRPGYTPADNCRDFSLVAEEFPYNELRASYNTAGRALVQRLQDKPHSWEGVQELIPDMLAAGILGYAYTCADMIGGGLAGDFFEKGFTIDHKVFVRSCQAHALMPMMQFSLSPWRVLTDEETAACKAAAELHVAFAPTILELARHASKTGEPIVRYMEYEFPHQGFEEVKDQFMLGSDWLVAPIVTPDDAREVRLPLGTWEDDTGVRHEGPKVLQLKNVPITRLPRYHRVSDKKNGSEE